ncbi:hypothetical protein JLBYU43_88 [Escherichia phage JLBYU43]|uniref:Uncharacterized protein n=1 Tax=Escherichia phage JLBYU43 TaxID=2894751 RepID=A0AAE8YWR0_9CAUD|nr:hypothetical protein JLBYU43_88 [Escherichia phage JLBYU43]
MYQIERDTDAGDSYYARSIGHSINLEFEDLEKQDKSTVG